MLFGLTAGFGRRRLNFNISFCLNPGYFFEFLDRHGHQYFQDVLLTHLQLFCSLLNSKLILFYSLSYFVLLVILFLLILVSLFGR